uniref:Uncharacterized protein n=1 Tax=Candidatus Kentrum sp. LPFa TaxID=2126335 RepID=A0A450WD15_9GAMM|nr:MAG: hypothetical protein BECKLPF1236B_GA0070989_10696 [Candidatus Kentron sp. LPFa]
MNKTIKKYQGNISYWIPAYQGNDGRVVDENLWFPLGFTNGFGFYPHDRYAGNSVIHTVIRIVNSGVNDASLSYIMNTFGDAFRHFLPRQDECHGEAEFHGGARAARGNDLAIDDHGLLGVDLR